MDLVEKDGAYEISAELPGRKQTRNPNALHLPRGATVRSTETGEQVKPEATGLHAKPVLRASHQDIADIKAVLMHSERCARRKAMGVRSRCNNRF